MREKRRKFEAERSLGHRYLLLNGDGYLRSNPIGDPIAAFLDKNAVS